MHAWLHAPTGNKVVLNELVIDVSCSLFFFHVLSTPVHMQTKLLQRMHYIYYDAKKKCSKSVFKPFVSTKASFQTKSLINRKKCCPQVYEL